MTKGLFRATAGLIIASAAALACGGTEPSPPSPPPPNLEITVSPALNGTFSGHSETHQLTATITDTLGNPLTGVTPLWSVFPAGQGVTVSQAGLATVAPLAQVIDYSIRATVEGITGSAILRMLPRPIGKLYFSTATSPSQQLFVKNLTNDLDAVQLTDGTGPIFGFDVDPVAGLIVFSRTVNQLAHLYRMNLDGSGLLALTSDGTQNQFPVIHPSTNEVYLNRRAPGVTVTQIWKMATDGTGLTQLTTGTQNKTHPAISSDGQRLAWTETFPGFNTEIMTADISGADPVRLTDRTGSDSSPFWFTNDRLFWQSLLGGSDSEIFATDLSATGAPVNVTMATASDAAPTAGCLPNTITFLSTRAGQTYDAFQLDLGNGLAVKYSIPTPRPISIARSVCE